MSQPMPRFVSLTPTVLSPDRVILALETTGFVGKSNVTLDFDLQAPPQPPSSTIDPSPLNDAPDEEDSPLADPEELIKNSPYPNVALSLLDKDGYEVAELFIVEHKEETLEMTLYIRRPEVGETYTARAEMIHNRTLLQTLSTPFTLSPAETI